MENLEASCSIKEKMLTQTSSEQVNHRRQGYENDRRWSSAFYNYCNGNTQSFPTQKVDANDWKMLHDLFMSQRHGVADQKNAFALHAHRYRTPMHAMFLQQQQKWRMPGSAIQPPGGALIQQLWNEHLLFGPQNRLLRQGTSSHPALISRHMPRPVGSSALDDSILLGMNSGKTMKHLLNDQSGMIKTHKNTIFCNKSIIMKGCGLKGQFIYASSKMIKCPTPCLIGLYNQYNWVKLLETFTPLAPLNV